MDSPPPPPPGGSGPSDLDIDMSNIDSQFLLSELDMDMGGLEGLDDDLAKTALPADGDSPSKTNSGKTPNANKSRPSPGSWASTLGAGAEWEVEGERKIDVVEVFLDWDGEEGSVGKSHRVALSRGRSLTGNPFWHSLDDSTAVSCSSRNAMGIVWRFRRAANSPVLAPIQRASHAETKG
jgi:hypothetical protein